MQLKDFILKLNTYSQVNHDSPVNRLIYYDLNHSKQEIFSYNFYLRPSIWNDLLFDFDNYFNLLLTSNEYNNDLYVIVNIKDDYYAYYRLSHRYGCLTFVIFKIYPPGTHDVFDAGRKSFFNCNCDDYFSTALWIVHRPRFNLLSLDEGLFNFNDQHVNESLFSALTRLNNLIEPYKLLYAIR